MKPVNAVTPNVTKTTCRYCGTGCRYCGTDHAARRAERLAAALAAARKGAIL